MRESIPQIIKWAKGVVGNTLTSLVSWPDAAAESIVRGAFGLVPASEASDVGRGVAEQPTKEITLGPHGRGTHSPTAGNYSPSGISHISTCSPTRPSRFVDEEEIAWLESGRHELPYRRDRLWAVPQMWYEMTLGEVGAGAYLAGAATGSVPAMAVGWGLSTIGKGTLLAADLGRPERLIRVFRKPDTSWISRGSWAYAGFSLIGGLSLLPLPEPVRRASRGVAAACAAVVGSYDGLFLHEAKSVAAWANSAVPMLFAVNGMAGGVQIANALTNHRSVRAAAAIGSASGAGIAAWYAASLAAGNTAARLAARDLLEGVQRNRFLINGIAAGGLGAALLGLGKARWARAAAGSLAGLGVLGMRRAILQAGIHAPVIDPPRGNRNPIDEMKTTTKKGEPHGEAVVS